MTNPGTAAAARTPSDHHDPDAEAAAAVLGAHRPMLYGLAYRLLGSAHDADDVLQEAYLRWLHTDRTTVAQPRRYLSRIVTHLAVDRLRHRQALRETYVGTWLPEPVPTDPGGGNYPGVPPLGPSDAAEQRESLSVAALHLLERLSPPERAVYVLRTAFDLPYGEIAGLLDRTPDACRQLHHRAAQRIGHDRQRFTAGPAEQERLVARFVAAARDGDVPGLVALLAADVTAWSDGGGKVRAARNPIRGAAKVARFFAGIYRSYGPVLRFTRIEVNGHPAIISERGGTRYVMVIAAASGQINDVYLIGNPEKLRLLSGSPGAEFTP